MPYFSPLRVVSALMTSFALLLALPAAAIELSVDTTEDYIDKNIGDGICEAEIVGIYKCTLRAAIQEANALSGLDRINIPAGLYVVTQGGPTDDTASQGDFDLRDDVELIGAGSASTIIDGDNRDRIFHVLSDANQVVHVAIRGLTVQRGYVLNQSGGGIYNAELATLDDVVVVNNGATISGGGIFNSGTLIASTVKIGENISARGAGMAVSGGESYLIDAEITGNQSTSNGAGVDQTAGTVELSRAVIRGNATTSTGSVGAGIHTTGTLSIYDTTIANNSSAGHGGGLGVTNGGVAKLNGSLIEGNSATSNGGGAYVDALLVANNVTVSANSRQMGAGFIRVT